MSQQPVERARFMRKRILFACAGAGALLLAALASLTLPSVEYVRGVVLINETTTQVVFRYKSGSKVSGEVRLAPDERTWVCIYRTRGRPQLDTRVEVSVVSAGGEYSRILTLRQLDSPSGMAGNAALVARDGGIEVSWSSPGTDSQPSAP